MAILVALLTFSASGASALVVPEPCTGYELPGSDDGTCPPTCVTCGCCAQAAEPAAVLVIESVQLPVADVPPRTPHLPDFDPRDILHVPKSRLA